MFDNNSAKNICFSKFSFSIQKKLSRYSLFLGLVFTLTLFSSCSAQMTATNPEGEWVGTWTTAPQLVEPRNNPPAPGLSSNTLRQVFCISLGGDNFRMRFSNEFSTNPVTMKSVHIALSVDSSEIDLDTDQPIKFNGSEEVTIQSGEAVISDPFMFPAAPRTKFAVTIYFGNTSPDVTGHPGSRTTSFIMRGNHISDKVFTESVKADHWYVINNMEVIAPKEAAAVAVVGNSITDGRGSGTNKQNRWPDILAERLLANPETENIAVLNQGIGGNCVTRNCLGPSAISRFERDVLKQSKVKWVIIFEGINDIGGIRSADFAKKISEKLIASYEEMIDSAHAAGIKVYGATLMPYKDSFYDTEYSQTAWKTVNEWIRTSGRFDAVIDFDTAMRDPNKPLNLLPEADTGDHLHPNETGHRMLGEAVDLELFK